MWSYIIHVGDEIVLKKHDAIIQYSVKRTPSGLVHAPRRALTAKLHPGRARIRKQNVSSAPSLCALWLEVQSVPRNNALELLRLFRAVPQDHTQHYITRTLSSSNPCFVVHAVPQGLFHHGLPPSPPPVITTLGDTLCMYCRNNLRA